MAVDYTNVATEVLGQMMRVAEQNKGVPAEQVKALREAVHARKKRLDEVLFSCQSFTGDQQRKQQRLRIFQELIALEPTNYNYYYGAGISCYWLEDYTAAIAYYTTALQLIDKDPDVIRSEDDFRELNRNYFLWEIYRWRGKAFLEAQQFQQAIEDGKMALRFLYTSSSWPHQDSYFSIMPVLYRSYKGLGQYVRAEALGTSYEEEVEYGDYNDQGERIITKEIEKGIHWKPWAELLRLLQIEV
jgi:tetratricopeptide (TPR) repeat protein